MEAIACAVNWTHGYEMPAEPTHYTDRVTKCVVRTESQVEREKRECAYFLNVVWPEISQP